MVKHYLSSDRDEGTNDNNGGEPSNYTGGGGTSKNITNTNRVSTLKVRAFLLITD